MSYWLANFSFAPSEGPHGVLPPPAFPPVLEPLTSMTGIQHIYHGQHIETPSTYALLIRFKSPDALSQFLAGPDYAAWMPTLSGMIDTGTLSVTTGVLSGDSLDGVFSAPVTEVFSAFDTVSTFAEDQMKPFYGKLKAAGLEGFEAGAWGAFEGKEGNAETGVRLCIGWTSREVHLSHKGPEAWIGKNVHMVEAGHKGTKMFHVAFQKL